MFAYAARSISIVLTSIYLLASVGACAVEPENAVFSSASERPAASPTQLSVNILLSVPEISRELQQATERYASESGSGAAFHIQTIHGAEDYRAALHTKLLSGEAVDLFHVTNRADVERLADSLEDLSSIPWAKSASSAALETVSIGSAQYGIPYSLEGVGLIVNRAMFASAGIDLAKITSYERLSEALAELQAAVDAEELAEEFPKLAAATDLAVQDVDYLSARISEALLYGAFSSPVQARESLSLRLSDPEGFESLLKLLAAASPQRGNWKAFPSVSYSRLIEDGIASGRIAAIIDSTDVHRRICAANPDLRESLALLPLYFPNSEQGVVLTGTPAWWAVNRSSSDAVKEQAKGFLTWLYQSGEGRDALQSIGVLSPYQDGGAGADLPLHRSLLQAIENGAAVPQLAGEIPAGWGEQVFSVQMQEYFTRYDKEWEEVVQACQTGWAERRAPTPDDPS